jgi:hypothetical protein
MAKKPRVRRPNPLRPRSKPTVAHVPSDLLEDLAKQLGDAPAHEIANEAMDTLDLFENIAEQHSRSRKQKVKRTIEHQQEQMTDYMLDMISSLAEDIPTKVRGKKGKPQSVSSTNTANSGDCCEQLLSMLKGWEKHLAKVEKSFIKHFPLNEHSLTKNINNWIKFNPKAGTKGTSSFVEQNVGDQADEFAKAGLHFDDITDGQKETSKGFDENNKKAKGFWKSIRGIGEAFLFSSTISESSFRRMSKGFNNTEKDADGLNSKIHTISVSLSDLYYNVARLDFRYSLEKFLPFGALIVAAGELQDDMKQLSITVGGFSTKSFNSFYDAINKTMLSIPIDQDLLVGLSEAFVNNGEAAKISTDQYEEFLKTNAQAMRVLGVSGRLAADFSKSMLNSGKSLKDINKSYRTLYKIGVQHNLSVQEIGDSMQDALDISKSYGFMGAKSIDKVATSLVKAKSVLKAMNMDTSLATDQIKKWGDSFEDAMESARAISFALGKDITQTFIDIREKPEEMISEKYKASLVSLFKYAGKNSMDAILFDTDELKRRGYSDSVIKEMKMSAMRSREIVAGQFGMSSSELSETSKQFQNWGKKTFGGIENFRNQIRLKGEKAVLELWQEEMKKQEVRQASWNDTVDDLNKGLFEFGNQLKATLQALFVTFGKPLLDVLTVFLQVINPVLKLLAEIASIGIVKYALMFLAGFLMFKKSLGTAVTLFKVFGGLFNKTLLGGIVKAFKSQAVMDAVSAVFKRAMATKVATSLLGGAVEGVAGAGLGAALSGLAWAAAGVATAVAPFLLLGAAIGGAVYGTYKLIKGMNDYSRVSTDREKALKDLQQSLSDQVKEGILTRQEAEKKYKDIVKQQNKDMGWYWTKKEIAANNEKLKITTQQLSAETQLNKSRKEALKQQQQQNDQIKKALPELGKHIDNVTDSSRGLKKVRLTPEQRRI